MFNLAITWDLFLSANPVRKVKFFREFDIGLRVVSSEEERNLLQNASPYLQDLIRFALNTGLRIGETSSLRWFERGFEERYSDCLCAKDRKAARDSNQFRNSPGSGGLEACRRMTLFSTIPRPANRLLISRPGSLLRVERQELKE